MCTYGRIMKFSERLLYKIAEMAKLTSLVRKKRLKSYMDFLLKKEKTELKIYSFGN